jgi:isocitrate dehydrogenase (NAD+)
MRARQPVHSTALSASRRITLIPGDGIGPEVIAAARRVLDAAAAAVEWEVHDVGAPALERTGEVLPDAVLESIVANGVALKGPVSTPAGTGFRSVNIALRRSLDLYAQVRPCRSFGGVPSRFDDVDLVVIRETTEDLYAGIEFERGSDAALALIDWLGAYGHDVDRQAGISLKPLSEPAARRIFRFAFDYARTNGRLKVTAVHKATVMKHTDGLFLRAAREVADENPDLEFEDRLVDNLVAELVRRPRQHDVLVMPNLYGDIVSDLAAGLVGSVGLAPGANYGPRAAVFEPAHGSAPKHAGKNRVNPVATILSGALLLRHVGQEKTADRIEGAVTEVIAERREVTYDLKPSPDDGSAATTSGFADAVVAKLTAAS